MDVNNTRSTCALLGVVFLATLSQPTLAAKPGAPCKPAGNDYDYSVSAVTSGVNLYATSSCGESLVNGSPFAPTPAPANIAGTSVPPEFVFVDRTKEHAYALYYTGVFTNEDVLWSFSVNSNGLQQQSSMAFGFPAAGDPKVSSDGVKFVGATEHIVYVLSYSNYDALDSSNLTVYPVDQGQLSPPTTVQLIAPVGNYNVINGPNSVRVDQAEHFLYACFTQTPVTVSVGPSEIPPFVSVFHLKAGAPTFAFYSSDPAYIASNCAQ
jgi:hypothetical protein